MKAAEALYQKLGSNMAESMGVRQPGEGGLGSGTADKAIAIATPTDGRKPVKNVGRISLDRIVSEKQVREHFNDEELRELAESMKTHTQLNAINVYWNQDRGAYVIIAGERRYRAAKLLQWSDIECKIEEGSLTETEIKVRQLIENVQRADLRPTETAKGYRELMGLRGWTVEQLGAEIGKGKAQVSKMLAVLKLPDDLQRLVDSDQLSMAHAYELSRVDNPEQQAELARRSLSEKLTRDQLADVIGAKRPRKADKPAEDGEGEVAAKDEKSQTKKVFETNNAKLTIVWAKKTVRPREVIETLEKVLAQLKSPPEDQPV